MRKNFFHFDILKNLGNFIVSHRFFLILLLISFIFRLLPILWGVPITPLVRNYHPDEPKVYNYIMNFPHSYFSFEYFKGYGTAIQVMLGFLFLPIKFVKVLGFIRLYEVIIIIFSRLTNVLFGTLTIFFTYLLANRIFDKQTGLLSALFYATAFYPVINSSVITLDVAMGLFITINFILSFYALRTNTKESFFVLGVASGLLLGTKITGALILPIPFILAFQYFRKNLRVYTRQTVPPGMFKNLFVYLLTVLIVFLVLNPYIYLYPARYFHFLLFQRDILIGRTVTRIWEIPFHWMTSDVISLGLPIAVFAVLGILFMRRQNLYLQLILFFFLLEYYLFWRWAMQPRYVISVAPILCIFGASFIIRVIHLRQNKFKKTGIGIAVAAICYSIYLCFSGILLRFNDTRTEGAEYISQNVKAGSSIGYSYISDKYPWNYHAWRYPKVDFTKYKNKNLLDRPDVIILSSYDFKQVKETLKSNKLNKDYKLDKKYFGEWYKSSPPTPKLFKFYNNLLNKKDSNYSLVKVFKKNITVPVEFPPPEIRIYKKIK